VILYFVISALGRLRQEDHKFKANLGYTVKPCLKNKDKTNRQKHGMSKHIK
jgi:hypothetical protein